MPPLDLNFVDRTIERLGRRSEMVIPILQAIQAHYRWLPPEAIERVCTRTDITPALITGVSTFYTQFRHRPVGRYIISVCHGTACHVKGSGLVQDALLRQLKIAEGNDTDAAGLFTIEKVACLGCCTLAPVIQIEGVTYGRLTPHRVGEAIGDFLERQRGGTRRPLASPFKPRGEVGEIRVGLGSCCQAQGSAKVYEAIQNTLARSGALAVVKRVGCVGMCHQTPLVEIMPPGAGKGDRILLCDDQRCASVPAGGPFRQKGSVPLSRGEAKLFSKVSADDAPAIVLRHFKPKGLWRRLGYAASHWLDKLATDEVEDAVAGHAIDVRDPPVCAFLGPQMHLATESCGQLDPTDFDEYRRHGGFQALEHALKLAPQQIIDQVQSGLRGRGGAGFPTGLKWARVRAAAGEQKYIICNGDEGDPGAFMDRMLLESFPYRVIEGMTIAARAVGADEGFFYIRAEYPLAVERITEALRRCREHGLLGERVLGSDFRLKLEIKEGAGAFVCGEETALLASLEGRRGMPRLRPPFPADSGLWGKPTLVNNVETYSLLPWIFRHGAAEFAALGTEKSKGTKVFALAGKVRRGGLIEVPMGVSIRQIVEQIGGGVAGDRTFKAVQVGGPSGGCVPADLADTPVDYEALTGVGAIMGSGGLVVLDDSDCMVDIARYFLRFTQDQSCGKCTFCRIGTRRMLDILDRICAGEGKPGDLEELEDLAATVAAGSICGLGRTAPNPVLSTLRYFRDEYEAHLAGRCPAGKCTALIAYRITDECIGCTLCAQQCPVNAIPMTPYVKHSIDQEKCTRCDTCRQVCPVKAVVVRMKDEG